MLYFFIDDFSGGDNMAAGIFFLFILLLIIAAWTDLKEGYIPDSVSILIFLLSFYSLFIRSGPGLLLRIEGAVLCGGLLEGIRLISRGGIGMGDVKLMTACGFFLGITTGAVSLVFAYILAGMFCLPLLIFKKASLKTRLPMAPFFTVSILKKRSLPGIWAYGVSCKGTSPSKCMEKPDIFVHVST
jgi:Flp pilus assembly protein protease CpaA